MDFFSGMLMIPIIGSHDKLTVCFYAYPCIRILGFFAGIITNPLFNIRIKIHRINPSVLFRAFL